MEGVGFLFFSQPCAAFSRARTLTSTKVVYVRCAEEQDISLQMRRTQEKVLQTLQSVDGCISDKVRMQA